MGRCAFIHVSSSPPLSLLITPAAVRASVLNLRSTSLSFPETELQLPKRAEKETYRRPLQDISRLLSPSADPTVSQKSRQAASHALRAHAVRTVTPYSAPNVFLHALPILHALTSTTPDGIPPTVTARLPLQKPRPGSRTAICSRPATERA